MADVDPARLYFQHGSYHTAHLLAYRKCDLMLDPFPHCGGITAVEALYMGVPVLTRYGKNPAGRIAASVLSAIGLTGFWATDEKNYRGLAIKWATDWADMLPGLRKRLRGKLLASKVCKDYVLAVEKAYQDIFRRWAK